MKTSKKILQVSLILSLLMAMTLMFAGCGGPETLEEYVNSDSESQITKLSSTFESAATTLEEGSGIDDVTVKVVYVDGAGTEIYSAEF